jgi:hypothetical protein
MMADLLAQYGGGGAGGSTAILIVIYIALTVFFVATYWRIFTKAGKPGWASLIPFYNTYVVLKIVGRPGWWLLLFLIPIVNIVILVLVSIDMAHSFGKRGGFVVGLILLPIIFYPILAFGDARYLGPGGQAATVVSQAAAYGAGPPPLPAIPPPPPPPPPAGG